MEIGWSELLVIGVVALVVIGPKDLPEMFRTLGRFTAKLRAMSRDFSRAMEDAARETGVHDVANDLRKVTSPTSMGLDAVKSAADKFEKWDPLKGTRPGAVTPALTPDPAAAPPAGASAVVAAAAQTPVSAQTPLTAPPAPLTAPAPGAAAEPAPGDAAAAVKRGGRTRASSPAKAEAAAPVAKAPAAKTPATKTPATKAKAATAAAPGPATKTSVKAKPASADAAPKAAKKKTPAKAAAAKDPA